MAAAAEAGRMTPARMKVFLHAAEHVAMCCELLSWCRVEVTRNMAETRLALWRARLFELCGLAGR